MFQLLAVVFFVIPMILLFGFLIIAGGYVLITTEYQKMKKALALDYQNFKKSIKR